MFMLKKVYGSAVFGVEATTITVQVDIEVIEQITHKCKQVILC